MDNLSKIGSLQAFEAVVRYGNYLDSSHELHVTPAAIGQHIRSLEEWLMVPLFRRLDQGRSRLQPTSAALNAIADIRQGLQLLSQGVAKMRQATSSQTIAVSASHSFTAKWLLPRLYDFTMNHPEYSVRLDVSDRVIDLSAGDIDVAIRCGAGRWRGVTSTKLMAEELFPVCSPAFLANNGPITHAKQLLQLPLIHDDATAIFAAFPSWPAWLRKFTKKAAPKHANAAALHINSSVAVIQAAINGAGVALARRHLVDDDLRDGRLVRLLPTNHWPIEWSYYLVTARQSTPNPALHAFCTWILASAPG
jgi:LysR family transcriptional regulator, glycine cleavage system transcriptional activator